MKNSVREWVRNRPATVGLSLFFTAWFAFQLVVLTLYGVETAKCLFYTELPPKWPPTLFGPGYLLAPISHEMSVYTHIISNIAFLLLVGGTLEPYVHRRKIPAVVIGGGYVGMIVTMATAPIHGFWPIAGASTGIMILWGYTGLRMWGELDLPGTFGEKRLERQVAVFVLLAVPAIPLYEVFIGGNMAHVVGIILGVLYFIVERAVK